MSLRYRAIAGMVFVTAALSACAPSVTGDAIPASPDSVLPPRPREIRIDDLNPCTAFSADQLRQLDIGGARFRPADEETGPRCQWRHSPYEPIESYLVLRTNDQGAENALGNPNGTTVTTIAGFPAIETQGLYSPELCRYRCSRTAPATSVRRLRR